jgi:hypothetical protein
MFIARGLSLAISREDMPACACLLAIRVIESDRYYKHSTPNGAEVVLPGSRGVT